LALNHDHNRILGDGVFDRLQIFGSRRSVRIGDVKIWAALSKAAWAVTGAIISGSVIQRFSRAQSR
jgi:hypothetical protein